MWKTWRWKGFKRTALHPLMTSSWAPKTTPPTRASVCQLVTVSAPGCLKSAFVEKVGALSHPTVSLSLAPITQFPHTLAPWHIFVFLLISPTPKKKKKVLPLSNPVPWLLSDIPTVWAGQILLSGSIINCADWDWRGYWTILWWLLREVQLFW